jgi:hypothetical protein
MTIDRISVGLLLLLLFVLGAIAGLVLDFLKIAYKAIGADYPVPSGVLMAALGGVGGWFLWGGYWWVGALVLGVVWWLIGRAYRKDHPVSPPAGKESATHQTATTAGNNSPATNIVVTGPNAKISVQPALSGTEVDRIAERLQTRMREEKAQKGPELARSYPLGYTIFAVTSQNKAIPFRDPQGRIWQFDWSLAHVRSDPETITIRLPDFVDPNHNSFSATTVRMRKAVGEKAVPMTISGMDLVLEVISTRSDAAVVALGMKPHTPPSR